jgi:DNA-directed RNA polymerase specialized sigma24 family protein
VPFTEFCRDVQPKLRHAFAARFGHVDGAEATAEALAFAWENWERVRAMDNPAGYLYRVGASKTRRIRRATPVLVAPPPGGIPEVEPGLPDAVAALSDKQRVSVLLVTGFGWTLGAVAELLGVSVSTVQNHVERGLKNLRRKLGAEA